jgi:phage-related minor tail protein
MAGNIKGLTVEIGGDTTKLDKALENVNKKSKDLSSELGQVNRLLKMDPGNTELVAQKQKILAEAVENTRNKLDTLKEAEKQVQAQFERGEVSEEQYRALQREIVATEQKLKGYESAAKQVADGNDKIARSAQEAAEEAEDLNESLDGFATGGLTGVAGAVTAAVAGLTAAAEATRDYRMEMGKLDTAFTDNGFSAEAATSAYTDLVGVLGETDQSVEAANHLAKLTDNEKDLATWTGDILPGVFATFGDSLPIEGLTEAANETAKVGQVTGPLADALNWAGINEDKFNESLAKCNTEQERQKLIMETMVGLYGQASESYKETNADVIAANQANAAWTESMAQVGAAVEPLITQVKTIGAELLSQLVPIIEKILANLPVVAVLVGGLTAALIAFKISALGGVAAIVTGIQAALASLWAAMLANPIGLIIVAVTALVAGFMYLWNNCEGFRKFWIDLWKKIKDAALKAVDWLKQLPQKIWGAIQGAIQRVTTWRNTLVNNIKTAATNMLSAAYNGLKNMPSRVYNAIKGALNRVVSWGSDMASRGKSAATKVLNAVVNGLKSLPSKIKSIGGDLVRGLWNGISDKVGWIKSKLSGFKDSVMNALKSFFGIHSPSTETAWIGDMLDQGLAEGIVRSADAPEKAMQRMTGGVLDAANGINGLNLNRQLENNFSASGGGMVEKLDKILAAIERGQIITIDGDALVGATADRIDKRLGQRRVLAARGAI